MSIGSGPSSGPQKEGVDIERQPVSVEWENTGIVFPEAQLIEITKTQKLLLQAFSHGLSLESEREWDQELDRSLPPESDLNSSILLACVSGVGMVSEQTESEILNLLKEESPVLAAFAISLRANMVAHPEFDLAQKVAYNYLAYLPAELAKMNLKMAFEGHQDEHILCRYAFDESKNAEFEKDCSEMRKTLSGGEKPLQIDEKALKDLTTVMQNALLIADPATGPIDLVSHVTSIAGVDDTELRMAALAFLLRVGHESVVEIARGFLQHEQPGLLRLMTTDQV